MVVVGIYLKQLLKRNVEHRILLCFFVVEVPPLVRVHLEALAFHHVSQHFPVPPLESASPFGRNSQRRIEGGRKGERYRGNRHASVTTSRHTLPRASLSNRARQILETYPLIISMVSPVPTSQSPRST